MRTQRLPGRIHSETGFTAVEIAMVASVIAILALLILPLFRKRTDEAKLVAARDELQSLAKAMILVEADTDRTFRLQELGQSDVPTGAFYRTLTADERARLTAPVAGSGTGEVGATFWRGPYIAFQKSISVNDLKNTTTTRRPYMFSDQGGPIYYVDNNDNDLRIPIDPWGSPYIFLDYRDTSFRTALRNDYGVETSYNQRVMYSLGPDGIPGSLGVNPGGFTTTDPFYYMVPYRINQGGVLGNPNSDDLEFIF